MKHIAIQCQFFFGFTGNMYSCCTSSIFLGVFALLFCTVNPTLLVNRRTNCCCNPASFCMILKYKSTMVPFIPQLEVVDHTSPNITVTGFCNLWVFSIDQVFAASQHDEKTLGLQFTFTLYDMKLVHGGPEYSQ